MAEPLFFLLLPLEPSSSPQARANGVLRYLAHPHRLLQVPELFLGRRGGIAPERSLHRPLARQNPRMPPGPTPVDAEAELDRLYELPLADFTAARDDLARRLKHDGDAERAAEVKRLRKPPAAVWLANRLARERELDVQRLAKAGETLMQGKAGAREARTEEQRTLVRLGQAVREIAARERIGGGAVDRALETVRAATLRDDARELLKRGRLTEELEPPGLEALEALARSAPTAKPSKRADRKREVEEARKRVRELQAEEREVVAVAREAEREAAQLRKRAQRAVEARVEAEAELKRLKG